MKVTIQTPEEKQEEISFPCLMQVDTTNVIILATSKNEDNTFNGICMDIGSNDNVYLGEYKDYWNSSFTPLQKGTKIILEN